MPCSKPCEAGSGFNTIETTTENASRKQAPIRTPNQSTRIRGSVGRGRKRYRRQKTTAKPELFQVPSDTVVSVWPLVEPLIAKELEQTDWASEDLRAMCANGSALLWLVFNEKDEAIMAMVTMLTIRQRCIVCICSGKNLWDYLELRHAVYDYAKDQGMKEVVFYGRKALARLMPECKEAGVILRKEL